MTSTAATAAKTAADVFEVVQWEPQWDRIKHVQGSSSTPLGDTTANVARRCAFRSDYGFWMAFRTLKLRPGLGHFEVKDLATITPPDSTRDGTSYYWNSGPGAAVAAPASPGGPSSRSVTFAVPLTQDQRVHAHHRWRVAFKDIVVVERHVFAKPLELVCQSNGEAVSGNVSFSLLTAARSGSGTPKENSMALVGGSNTSSSLSHWFFRLWGPCGLVVSLTGDVDLFLVCASAKLASELQAALTRCQRAARKPALAIQVPRHAAVTSMAAHGMDPSPQRQQPSEVASPILCPRATSTRSVENSPLWSPMNAKVYNPSFASLVNPGRLVGDPPELPAAASGSHSELFSSATTLLNSQPRLPVSSTSFPALYQNTLPTDGRPQFLAGFSTSSALSAPPCGVTLASTGSTMISSAPLPLPYFGTLTTPQTASHALVAPLSAALTGKPPSKNTVHIRPLGDDKMSYRKVHFVPGKDTKKTQSAKPFPEQWLYLSKYRTCFLHRLEHRLRADRTGSCVAINLLQTTIIDRHSEALSFVLEYACLSVHAQDWFALATIRDVPHPLSQPSHPRFAHVLLLDVLAASLTAKRDWIDWMTKRGAAVLPITEESPPLQLTAPVAETGQPAVPDAHTATLAIGSETVRPDTCDAPAAVHSSFSPAEQDATDCYVPSPAYRDDSSLSNSDHGPRDRRSTGLLATDGDTPTDAAPQSKSSPPDMPLPPAKVLTSSAKLVAAGMPTPGLGDPPERATVPTTQPEMYGRVSPLWVSASYSPDERGTRPAAATAPPKRPFHSPLSIATSANNTPHPRAHADQATADRSGAAESDCRRGRCDGAPDNFSAAAKLSLLADTSPTQTVDVDTTDNTSRDVGDAGNYGDEAVYDAPLVSSDDGAHDGDGGSGGSRTFRVQRPTHGAAARANVPAQILAASVSLRRHTSPALPLQDSAQSSATYTSGAAVAEQHPPPPRRLPPPTPPADLMSGENSDFDAVAYRLEHISHAVRGSPPRPPRGVVDIPDESSPVIYDNSVVLTSTATPTTPHTDSARARALRTRDFDTTERLSGAYGGGHADWAHQVDSPFRASTTSLSGTTRSTPTPSSALKLPSIGSPAPVMRGQILFHPRASPTRESSTAHTLASVSPPTSRNSTADVATAVSSPLRDFNGSGNDKPRAVDHDVVFCGPDVLQRQSRHHTGPLFAMRDGSESVHDGPKRTASLLTTATPSARCGSEQSLDAVPTAMRPFFEVIDTPLSNNRGSTSAATHCDPETPDWRRSQYERRGWMPSDERKRAFRQSLHALREANTHGNF